MYRRAWESAIRGRHLVVKPTGSFYESISLPIISLRKPTCKKKYQAKSKAKAASQQGRVLYTEELTDKECVNTFHDPESFVDKIAELMASKKPFRLAMDTNPVTAENITNDNTTDADSDKGIKPKNDVTDDITPDVTDDATDDGTKPDIDMMVVDLDKKLCHIGEQCGEDLFAVMVPSEHPGFLHLVHPQTNEYISTDWFRSLENVDDARAIAILCFCKRVKHKPLPKITSITNQGPAITLEFDVSDPTIKFTNSMDIVRSLYCPKWPPEARRWDDKVYKWPNRELADTIIHDGCHIVAVPHPLCRDAKYEFRYSFSHAEVLLSNSVVKGVGSQSEYSKTSCIHGDQNDDQILHLRKHPYKSKVIMQRRHFTGTWNQMTV